MTGVVVHQPRASCGRRPLKYFRTEHMYAYDAWDSPLTGDGYALPYAGRRPARVDTVRVRQGGSWWCTVRRIPCVSRLTPCTRHSTTHVHNVMHKRLLKRMNKTRTTNVDTTAIVASYECHTISLCDFRYSLRRIKINEIKFRQLCHPETFLKNFSTPRRGGSNLRA